MMRLVDGRTLTESPRDRRAAARVLYEQGESRRLLAFRVADTHVHALLASSREEAGAFATYAGSALRWALGLPRPFAPSFVQPVLDQRHLYNTFRYVFRQEQRHGTAFDRAHEGSSLVDLCGLRVLGRATCARVATLLPRLGRAELMQLFDVDLPGLPPRWDALGDAAAAAAGIDSLCGRGAGVFEARAAAVHATARAVPAAQLALLLGVSARSVHRLRETERDAALVRAVELQLRLRGALESVVDGRAG